jgi:hypothetical protein
MSCIKYINILCQVSNLLAQKETEWNRNMARSQKTIAMLTMFFLPATFFAVRNISSILLLVSCAHQNVKGAGKILISRADSLHAPAFQLGPV